MNWQGTTWYFTGLRNINVSNTFPYTSVLNSKIQRTLLDIFGPDYTQMIDSNSH